MNMPILGDGGLALRGFLPYLTAAMLAAHALLGCCWHHAHACGQTHDPLALAGWQHNAEAHGDGATGCSDRSSHERDDCRAPRCDFVVSARVNPPALSPAPSLSAVPTVPGADQASLGNSLEQPFGTAGVRLPPVRLHLANQVLLI